MPIIQYIDTGFRRSSLDIIEYANEICQEYRRLGFDLTLRQVYYQFVARGLIANKDTEYDRLGSIINDARLRGYMDWDFITDRTRNVRGNSHWSTPASVVRAAADSYRIDLWEGQPRRYEVWIEKDALVGVIANVCSDLDVQYFSCRGYTSQSEVWAAAQRIGEHIDADQQVTIVHLGDHDPSGIDMTRDIRDRLELFIEGDGRDPGMLEVDRIALNYDQVQAYNPPPNPAKLTDSRSTGYISKYGNESWELDALPPNTIVDLVRNRIEGERDDTLWQARVDRWQAEKATLLKISRHYRDIAGVIAKY